MKKDPKNPKPTNAPKVQAVIAAYDERSGSDPFGSYTGRPREKGEIPVQDVDDL